MSAEVTLESGQVLVGVHPESACAARPSCVIHRPSAHSMSEFPRQWRQAGPWDIKPSHMERICPHGVGHPDPDSIAFLESVGEFGVDVHGCDGCCK